jgi:hypothetical protein
VRLFLTIPFETLPQGNKQFVTTLANSAGISDLITDKTLILSLMGTRGQNPDWNDRRKSAGHVGIPLASSEFISSIPMMSRLLKQLGVDLDWIDRTDTGIVSGHNLSRFGGMFYVRDAKEEIDRRGRKIIAAQDFVANYGVKTVFGFGGGILAGEEFVVVIAFTRETINRSTLEPYMSIINSCKIAAMEPLIQGRFFSEM